MWVLVFCRYWALKGLFVFSIPTDYRFWLVMCFYDIFVKLGVRTTYMNIYELCFIFLMTASYMPKHVALNYPIQERVVADGCNPSVYLHHNRMSHIKILYSYAVRITCTIHMLRMPTKIVRKMYDCVFLSSDWCLGYTVHSWRHGNKHLDF